VSWRRYTVRGRVQGVGFRAFVARVARTAGVRGAARNEDDGSVIAVAEGDPAALERFEAALRTGPPYARVVEIAAEELAERPAHEGFDLDF
jgi:acylphosphatase